MSATPEDVASSVGAVADPAPADPGIDLTGLDQFRLPQLNAALGDINANVRSAEGGVQDAAAYQDSVVEGARGNMEDARRAAEEAAQRVQDQGQAPEDHMGTLMRFSPWLVALSVFGGARSKLSANNMMGAQIGMIDGINRGDEEGFNASYKRWKDEHDKFADMMNQKWTVYKEMAKAYQGAIDGKQRALQIAEQAVRDARSDRAHILTAWNQQVRAGLALKDLQRKFAHDQDQATHWTRADDTAKERADTTKEKTAGKDAKKDEAVSTLDRQIDDAIGALDASRVGNALPVTGVGGKIRRGVETAGNVTGISSDTSAHDFEGKIDAIKLAAAPVLAQTGRTAKDQRERIDSIIRGLKAGDTPENTRSALQELKKLIHGMKADKFEAGKVYTDAKGNRAKYMGNGQWQPQQSSSTPAPQ